MATSEGVDDDAEVIAAKEEETGAEREPALELWSDGEEEAKERVWIVGVPFCRRSIAIIMASYRSSSPSPSNEEAIKPRSSQPTATMGKGKPRNWLR